MARTKAKPNHEPEVAQSAPGKPSASESPSTKRKRDTSDTGASPEKEKKAKGEVAAKAVDPAVPFADCLSAEGTMTVYVDGDPSWESLESGEVEDVCNLWIGKDVMKISEQLATMKAAHKEEKESGPKFEMGIRINMTAMLFGYDDDDEFGDDDDDDEVYDLVQSVRVLGCTWKKGDYVTIKSDGGLKEDQKGDFWTKATVSREKPKGTPSFPVGLTPVSFECEEWEERGKCVKGFYLSNWCPITQEEHAMVQRVGNTFFGTDSDE